MAKRNREGIHRESQSIWGRKGLFRGSFKSLAPIVSANFLMRGGIIFGRGVSLQMNFRIYMLISPEPMRTAIKGPGMMRMNKPRNQAIRSPMKPHGQTRQAVDTGCASIGGLVGPVFHRRALLSLAGGLAGVLTSVIKGDNKDAAML